MPKLQGSSQKAHTDRSRLIPLLGPAFVAAVAYVDPGNVAANITAGARYGYLLVWVLVLSNLSAMLVQYQSAKLGLITKKSLPTLLGIRLHRPARLAFWVQAELVAAATDLAEVIGGALALRLLFGLPLFTGGLIVGTVSTILLIWQNTGKQRIFEGIVVALLVIITIGFLAGLAFAPPSPTGLAEGLIPRFAGHDSILVAASMLGATVMPHAVYLHSSLVNDHHDSLPAPEKLPRLLRAARIDIGWALSLAGLVNIGLLLLAASALFGVTGTDTIEGAHAAITTALGPTVAVIFAIGLLASGLASTSVGVYAGSEIMLGLLHVKIPLIVRRLVTLVPALIILGMGIEPTWALVISQAFLSFGIPFAIVPLMALTRNRELMGVYADSLPTRIASDIVATLIIGLNIVLLVLTALGIGA